MSTLLLSHPATLKHDMGAGHPECAQRITSVLAALAAHEFDALERAEAALAATSAVLRVHPSDYFNALRDAAPSEGRVRIDGDTFMNSGTWDAVLRAAGGATQAVDAVMAGAADNAFVATRPPGHHAETATAMGFCFFNNIAIAARHAQAVHGAKRVAIVDFDVHHGNGTQEIFYDDPNVLFCSTHQMPLYPGSGDKSERGTHGTIVNVPLRAGDDGGVFRAAMTSIILPRINNFAPDIILISAGFDAHRDDPLGGLQFDADDFHWATAKVMEMAQKHSNNRVISVLEGGYDLAGLAQSASAHVRALMGN